MTFELMTKKPQTLQKIHVPKASYPFAQMKAVPNTGFVIPAEKRDEYFQHCRVLASKYNKQHGTNIRCNVLPDGSLRVWNESNDVLIAETNNTEALLAESIRIAEAKKAEVKPETSKEQVPTKEQFIAYLTADTFKPGMSITLDKEYIHRFEDFTEWAEELEIFETEIQFNPPSLTIRKKVA
jgi:hypothetical protein